MSDNLSKARSRKIDKSNPNLECYTSNSESSFTNIQHIVEHVNPNVRPSRSTWVKISSKEPATAFAAVIRVRAEERGYENHVYVPRKVWRGLGGKDEETIGVTLAYAGKWAWATGSLHWLFYCADFKKRITKGWWKKALALVPPVCGFVAAIFILSNPLCWIVPLISVAVSALIIIFMH